MPQTTSPLDKFPVNTAYYYENDDIWYLLNLSPKNPNGHLISQDGRDVVLVAPISEEGEALQNILREDFHFNSNNPRKIIVPLINAQQSHIKGIIIDIANDGSIKAIYADSLGKNVEIPETMKNSIKAIYSDKVKFYVGFEGMWEQGDSVICGGCTVENLLMGADVKPIRNFPGDKELRKEHIKLLGEDFARKQHENRVNILYQGDIYSHGRVVFSEEQRQQINNSIVSILDIEDFQIRKNFIDALQYYDVTEISKYNENIRTVLNNHPQLEQVKKIFLKPNDKYSMQLDHEVVKAISEKLMLEYTHRKLPEEEKILQGKLRDILKVPGKDAKATEQIVSLGTLLIKDFILSKKNSNDAFEKFCQDFKLVKAETIKQSFDMLYQLEGELVDRILERSQSYPSPDHIYRGLGGNGEFVSGQGLMVEEIYKGSPAESLGINIGDTITHVWTDGIFKDIRTLEKSKAVALIRGRPDCEIKLLISREGKELVLGASKNIHNEVINPKLKTLEYFTLHDRAKKEWLNEAIKDPDLNNNIKDTIRKLRDNLEKLPQDATHFQKKSSKYQNMSNLEKESIRAIRRDYKSRIIRNSIPTR